MRITTKRMQYFDMAINLFIYLLLIWQL